MERIQRNDALLCIFDGRGHFLPLGSGMEQLRLSLNARIRCLTDLDGGRKIWFLGTEPVAPLECLAVKGDGVFEMLSRILSRPLHPRALESAVLFARRWETDGESCPATVEKVFLEPQSWGGGEDWDIRFRVHFTGARREGRFYPKEGRFVCESSGL